MPPPHPDTSLWSDSIEQLCTALATTPDGLRSSECDERASRGRAIAHRRTQAVWILLAQFKSPILLLLVGAAIVSAFVGDPIGASLIIAIVVASGALGFWQEYKAGRAVDELLALVTTTASVLRDGAAVSLRSIASCPATSCCSPRATRCRATRVCSRRATCSSTRPRSPARALPRRRSRASSRTRPRREAHQRGVRGHARRHRHRSRADRAHGRRYDARRHLRVGSAQAAADRVRDRDPPLRAPAARGHAAARARDLRGQRRASIGRRSTRCCSRSRSRSGSRRSCCPR